MMLEPFKSIAEATTELVHHATVLASSLDQVVVAI